jgi:hypothetical protein
MDDAVTSDAFAPHDHCRVPVAPSQGASPDFLPNKEVGDRLQPAGSSRWLEGFLRVDLQQLSCFRSVGLTPLAPTSDGVRRT